MSGMLGDIPPLPPEAPSDSTDAPDARQEVGPAVPLPSTRAVVPAFSPYVRTSSLTPVVCDERAIAGLLEALLTRSGVSVKEAARRLGCSPQSIRQYLHGRRDKPSLLWFVRLAAVCGVTVKVEFPAKS